MRNLWDETEAAKHSGDLGEITYGSRLIGAEPALVLHGGGNTSIKSTSADIHGKPVELLYVKGSGWDLATIEPPGFAPLLLEPVRQLAQLPSLSDTEMVNQLRLNLTDSSAPNPSVEAILHASLPFKSVLHTHADAVLALTNTSDGDSRVRELWGDRVVVIPYVMPGFDLARVCAEQFAAQAHDDTEAMVLLNHGIFTFGSTTREAYDSMIAVITEAEEYLAQHQQTSGSTGGSAKGPAGSFADQATQNEPASDSQALTIAELRSQISAAAGRSLLLRRTSGALRFCQHPDVESLATRGPATPDHIIRTKQFPLVGRDVAKFATDYRAYFDRNNERHSQQGSAHRTDPQPTIASELTMLDPAPRVVLDAELGLLTAGKSATDCDIAAEIYLHTIQVIAAAEALGGYQALGEADLFDVEYWELEQAKLRRSAGGSDPLAGQVALVTGAASGIGKAVASALGSQAAAVVGLDIDPAIGSTFEHASWRNNWLGMGADVTQPEALNRAFNTAVEVFGGVDILVVAAGIFGPADPLSELDAEQWQRTLDINLSSVAFTLNQAHRFLKLSPTGGRVVLIGSKNVPAPGTSAAAYSASKAGLTQLGRVAALEWASDNITVNTVHPDAVFDTGLWSDELVAERASSYGMTPEAYRKRNLLGREITSADVGELVATLCSPAFGATTGAQIPIDGGSDRVI